jgi:ubiquinone/menaquinone biosynthesis C-methylase UbiE
MASLIRLAFTTLGSKRLTSDETLTEPTLDIKKREIYPLIKVLALNLTSKSLIINKSYLFSKVAQDLKKLVIEAYSGANAQLEYKKYAHEGLWDSEKYLVEKYFTRPGKVLDLGCGTGRTTMPLHQMGYDVLGADITPDMIISAKEIAAEKKLNIHYEIGDATKLAHRTNKFDYILFSNQGWAQIPGSKNRQKSLIEMHRVLKPEGILIFSIHPRLYNLDHARFWIKQAKRFYMLKPLGFEINEEEFGDRFFTSENLDGPQTYDTYQYIHVPRVSSVKEQVQKASFELLETNSELQISPNDIRKHPPVFFICRK